MRNRKRISLIVWLLLICMTLTAFSGCGKKDTETSAPTDATDAATLPAADNANALAQLEQSGSLLSWEMRAAVWSSSNGATVTFLAQPREYTAGQAASFVVRLEGKEVENKSCDWDGTYYTAEVDLEAADGYEYECVIYPAEGASERFTLSDVYDSLVYLKTSLNAYCNLYISDFKAEDGKFTVTAGFAHVQLPQLTRDGTEVSFERAQLVFLLNGEQIETHDIDLPKGEGVGSHEASLSSISFTMPQMDDDYQLDLMLQVLLSDGQELTSNGGSWYYNNGELSMAAG